MTASNLDLVRSILAGWEHGDWSSAEWADPEIEFEAVGGRDPVRVTGVAALTESWREWVSTWSDYHAQAEQYRDVDRDRVLVLIRRGGHGAASSVEVEAEGANVSHLRDGKVVKLALYWDRERAFADLGLAPEGDSER